ncbi:MAG: CRISPR-associated endonuclease Cas2 [Acidimicrobiales bacterium]
MSGRRRYLVGYDISADFRLRRVHKLVSGYGHSLQYSLFICDLNKREKLDLMAKLDDVINVRADRVCFVDLGEPAGRGVECFEFLGVRPALPVSGSATII